jgi:hypothetical protein
MRIKTSIISAAVVALLALAPGVYAQNEPAAPNNQMMQGSRHAQMRERLAEACKDKKANDPCSFTRRNGSTANGTCETRAGELLCIPAGMMHRGAMGGGMMGTPSGNMGGGGATGAPGGGAGSSNQ